MEEVYNVVLIDDDHVSNFLHAQVLEESGLVKNSYIYTQPDKVLKFLRAAAGDHPDFRREGVPDLMLLDLKMPGLDGFEFMEEYNHIPGIERLRIQVYMVTSSNHPRDVEKARQYRMAGYVNKPLTGESLNAMLGSCRENRLDIEP